MSRHPSGGTIAWTTINCQFLLVHLELKILIFPISIHINLSNIVFLIIFLFWLNFQEACITGVDALGFDARVCSGTQLQTLRFAFETPVCMMPLFQLTVLSYSPFLLCMESLQFATCFIFSFQATSEYSAEIQLNDLLFPKKKKPIR